MRFISGLVFLPLLLKTVASSPSSLPRQADSVAFFDPAVNGGSQLENAGNGLGEPLNRSTQPTYKVIISGLSSPEVLTGDGILNWAKSVGFTFGCPDLKAPQTANLGDGNGATEQIADIRQVLDDGILGSCLKVLDGSGVNHFRYWQQNGAQANSGAFFLAVSQDENLGTIAPNGYDSGRDALVAAATSGPTSFGGVTYTATSENIPGLLPVGSAGVNGGISLDGIVKLLTITIV